VKLLLLNVVCVYGETIYLVFMANLLLNERCNVCIGVFKCLTIVVFKESFLASAVTIKGEVCVIGYRKSLRVIGFI